MIGEAVDMVVIHQAAPAIYAHLVDSLPYEAVGLVWSDGHITRLINQARAADRFSVGQTQLAEVFAANDPGTRILVAYYHTHPTGSLDLSATDRESLRLQYVAGVGIPWVVMDGEGNWAVWEWDEQVGSVFLLRSGLVVTDA